MSTERIAFTDCTYATNLQAVDIKVKNTGTSILSIDKVLVNNQLNSSGSGWTVTTSVADRTLNPGEEVTIRIDAGKYPAKSGIISSKFFAGANYAFTVVTAKKNQFGPYTKAAPL